MDAERVIEELRERGISHDVLRGRRMTGPATSVNVSHHDCRFTIYFSSRYPVLYVQSVGAPEILAEIGKVLVPVRGPGPFNGYMYWSSLDKLGPVFSALTARRLI